MIWLLLLSTLFVARCGGQTSSSFKDDGWPGGSFGLPKPKSGCPGDETDGWYEGWRFQDMEDDRKSLDRRTRTSPGSHMSATISEDKKDIRRKFCMKQNTRVQKYWPKGKYCIYRQGGTCPENMNPGWVKWDDEDYKNNNQKGGRLPDGTYNKDTVIQYCCQTKGNWYASIELPVSQPFYLLTSSATGSSKCQMVKWALSYLEYIVFDTEDDNNADKEGGFHVFLQGRKLYYCYYEDCRSTLSGPGGSFRSYKATDRDMDPRSQYCSWLITIAESYAVSLKFQELTIPSCDDTFLKIFDGPNDAAPLLGTYCGTNASTEIEILSSKNNLLIVSNSGRYARYPKSIFSFHAQYNAEHMTGCHYEVLGDTGYIRSPKFDSPKDYPRHSSCSWLITVDDVDLVVFNFSFLNIRDDDVIEVYDGHDENTSLLAFHSRLNISKNDSAFLSSSNSVFIILKYGTSSNSQTEFVCEYGSQPKPTLQVISTSVPRKKNTQEPNRETADQSGSSQTTNIVVAVVVGVVIVLILIAILIFIRRRKKKDGTARTIHVLNPSYSCRKNTSASEEDSQCYATPSSPQEKVWVGNSKICKESNNPIYQPAEDQQPVALYESVDNTCEPLVKNKSGAAQADNPLYDLGGVATTHVYAEPTTSFQQTVVYDEPGVKV